MLRGPGGRPGFSGEFLCGTVIWTVPFFYGWCGAVRAEAAPKIAIEGAPSILDKRGDFS